jgi:S1-C subfamily serine protease
VAAGSIASRWGIHAGTLRANVEGEALVLGGDIILGVNDVQVEEGGGNCSDIYASIIKLKPGDNISIKLFRRGQIVKLSLPVAP